MNILIVATYVMAAATVGVWLRLLGVDIAISALAVAVQILVSMQLHMSFLRRRDKRRIAREMSGAEAGRLRIHPCARRHAFEKMEEMKAAMEAKALCAEPQDRQRAAGLWKA